MSNKYVLPELGYAFDALEPYFDALTMEIHHDRHHQTYVNNSNAIIEKNPELYEECPAVLCRKVSSLDKDLQVPVRNNVGGHFNHSLFWELLKKDVEIPAKLEELLVENFGSVDNFKDLFSKAAATRFGSGWAWLVLTKEGKLAVCSTPNQDNPLMGKEIAGCEGIPLLALDVWEHAYYLKYQNKRPDYIASFWNVVNWDEVLNRYNRFISKCN